MTYSAAELGVAAELLALHPSAPLPAARCGADHPTFDTSRATFNAVVAALPKARGAGPSSQRFEALRLACECGWEDEIFALITALNAG